MSGNTVHQLSYGQDESYPACVSFKLELTEKIAELCQQGVVDFFTNCEHGVSMWAAEAIIAMRNTVGMPQARVHIVMPFEEQANKYPDNVRERFFNIHAQADSVEILNGKYAEGCYETANRYMLDHSVMLLVDEIDGESETSELVDYAKAKNKHVAVVKSLAVL